METNEPVNLREKIRDRKKRKRENKKKKIKR